MIRAGAKGVAGSRSGRWKLEDAKARFSEVVRQARAAGHAPPVIDAMLAATAIEHDLYLVTRNVKDARTSGASIFDPWNDDPRRFPLSLKMGRAR